MLNQPKLAIRRGIIATLSSLLGVLLCAALLGWSRSTGYRFLWAAGFALFTVGAYRFFAIEGKRERRCFGIFGFLFIVAQAMGYRLQLAQHSGLDGIALCLGIGACLAPAAGYVAFVLARALSKPNDVPCGAQGELSRVFWSSFAIIFICWMPVFLAYYPGLFAYDVMTQISEILSGSLTNRNPLLHTLFLGGFYLLGKAMGSPTAGMAMYTIAQMLIMAAIFAWLLRYLASLGCRRALRRASLVFFAVLPIHSMLAISATKDVLFCGVLLLFAIRLHRLTTNPALLKSPRYFAGTLAVAALMCLLRNNAFFGLLLCIPLGLLVVPQGLRLRLTALVLGALVMYCGVSTGLKAAFGASGISSTELVSLPSQQLGRVYALHKDELPASVEIEYYLPTVSDYKPYTADPVKSVAVVNRPERMWSFLKLWGKTGLQYPLEYIDAILFNMQGYWWLDDTTHAMIYGEGLEGRLGYLLSDTKEGFDVDHTSLLPALETLYENLFSANEYQSLPVLSLLFAPSLYVWLVALLLCVAIVRRRGSTALLCGFLLVYLLPLWFGACVLIRYAYPLIVCLPLLLADVGLPQGDSKSMPEVEKQ